MNNRYVEISVRVPEYLLNRKWNIEKALKNRIVRGKAILNVKISFSQKYLKENLAINGDLIRLYFSQIESFELPLNVSIGDLMKLPYAVESLNKEIEDADWNMFLEQIDRLIDGFFDSADREGESLKRDIQDRMFLIRKEITATEKLPEKTLNSYRDVLIKRIKKLQMEDFVDENRLYKEISYFAENQDFTEELVRLRSHSDTFAEIMDDERTEKGKRLNFLLQEMNREINTVGSKCKDSEIARHVINIKEELEKSGNRFRMCGSKEGLFMGDLLNIGFKNAVPKERVIAILAPSSAPMKRLKEGAKENGLLIDATQGKKTRAVIVTDSNHVVLSAIQSETLIQRYEGKTPEDY